MARTPFVPPRVPFTRLPQADQVSSDIYDKTASIAANTDANKTAIEQNKAAADAALADQTKQVTSIQSAPALNGRSVLGQRTVTQSAYMLATDHTIIFFITAAARCTLPNCRQNAGQTFSVKCRADSTNSVTLNSQGNETVDGAAATTIVLAAGKAITLQSDGQNWIILSQIP